MTALELALKIAPLNFTPADLEFLAAQLGPCVERINEIEARDGGRQLDLLKDYARVDPNCPVGVLR